MKKKLVVLSGAGISAESGISTFRDSNGLWENHRIEDVASPEGFARNPQLVLDFYNLTFFVGERFCENKHTNLLF